MPHPTPQNAFGKTYGEHRETLELSQNQHKELLDYANSIGVEYSCSVFDIVSTQNILDINPNHIKIPSPINNNEEVIELIAKNFDGIIHISLGMTTKREEEDLIKILEKHNKLKNTVLYHCVSSYPTQDKDASILEILNLKINYSNKIKAIGLSAHHLDFLPDCQQFLLPISKFPVVQSISFPFTKR